MEEIQYSELKGINIHILEAIDSFCRRHSISYSLGYGSLLGAVRHKGFIPWDDDIDIIMLRDDYDTFVKGFNESNERYKVSSFFSDKQIHYPFAKVYDTCTVKDELGYKKYGIGIDLFPIDKISKESRKARQYISRQKKLWKLMLVKSLRWKENRSILKNILLLMGRWALSVVPYSSINKRMDKNARHFNYMQADFDYACMMGPYGLKEIMPPSVFISGYSDLVFEDGSFSCLKDYDTYLKRLYGDYMKLPPIEQRVTHHDFKAYWLK